MHEIQCMFSVRLELVKGCVYTIRDAWIIGMLPCLAQSVSLFMVIRRKR